MQFYSEIVRSVLSVVRSFYILLNIILKLFQIEVSPFWIPMVLAGLHTCPQNISPPKHLKIKPVGFLATKNYPLPA